MRVFVGMVSVALICAGCSRYLPASSGPASSRPTSTDSAPLDAYDASGEVLRPPRVQRWGPSQFFSVQASSAIDLLFVVETAPHMIGPQEKLIDAFNGFLDALLAITGDSLDLRIGVISGDLGAGAYQGLSCRVGGDDGRLQTGSPSASCPMPTEAYLAYAAGESNVPGPNHELDKVKQAFSCIARLGAEGCAFSQPLGALQRLLDRAKQGATGFPRRDTPMLIVLLATQDDCSAGRLGFFSPETESLGLLSPFRCFEGGIRCDENDATSSGPRAACSPATNSWLYHPSDYARLFVPKSRLGQVALAVFAGPPDPVTVRISASVPSLAPSCQSPGIAATPAIRLRSLVDSMGSLGSFSSICDSYAPTLERLALQAGAQLGRLFCLRDPVDTDRYAPGLQASCHINEIDSARTGRQQIPRCSERAGPCDPCPCWRVHKSTKCQAFGGYAIEIVRAGNAPMGSMLEASCEATR